MRLVFVPKLAPRTAVSAVCCSHPLYARRGTFLATKTASVYVAIPPSGRFDLNVQLLARSYGQHILRDPTAVCTNVSGEHGASDIKYFHNAAQKMAWRCWRRSLMPRKTKFRDEWSSIQCRKTPVDWQHRLARGKSAEQSRIRFRGRH